MSAKAPICRSDPRIIRDFGADAEATSANATAAEALKPSLNSPYRLLFFWNFLARPRESTVSAGGLPLRVSERRMSASQQQSDAELLRLMLAGDEEAFTALYRRRQGGVYRFALRMSGSEALAEDVVQETF